MIIGLEGVSCVGKTTLAGILAADLDAVHVRCYYHAAPDPSWLPEIDHSTADTQLDALARLMRVEELRQETVQEAVRAGRHVVMDRTVDTLLAHGHAISRLRGFDCDAAARAFVLAHEVELPDLTLLLTVDLETRTQRAARRPGMPRLLYDDAFTTHFLDHFRRPLVTRCITVDATDPAHLLETARHWIRVQETGSPVATAETGRSTC